jgi:N-acetylmuramoyl-L-alanine amidase
MYTKSLIRLYGARLAAKARAGLLCVAIACHGMPVLAGVTVKDVRLGSSADAQRLVFEFAAPVTYKHFTLANPHRLVLDLFDIDPASDALREIATRVNAGDPYLSALRMAANRPGVTRIVADLKTAMQPLVSIYPANTDYGPRLVVDLVPGLATKAAASGVGAIDAAVEAAPAGTPSTTMPAQIAANAVAARPEGKSDVGAVAKTEAKHDAKPEPKPEHKAEAKPDPKPEPKAEQRAEPKAEPKSETKMLAKAEVKNEPKVEAKAEARTEAKKEAKTETRVAVPQKEPVTENSRMVVAPADPAPVKQAADKAPLESEKHAGAAAPAKPASLEVQVERAIRQSGNTGAPKASHQAKAPENNYKRLITVAIDAGHGGVDPGASGANGTKEKDITLAVAKRLKTHIDARDGMRAVLTRDGDTFIALHERVNKARRAQADLFVSIHADAFLKSSAKGSSVFALSEKGATSAAARWLAKRENEADLVGGINIDVKNVYLKQTLIDLSQTATIADSLKLGRAVLDQLGEINDLHKAKVEQAGFAVLKAPDIPSILVETAFISNPDEEKRLLDEEYQEKMAAAIVEGIKAYFDANPPLARNKVAQNL